MTMSDLIDRQDAINALVEKGQSSKRYKLGEFWELNLSEIKEALDRVPSVEPERKRGEWEDRAVYYLAKCEYQTAQCSVCGKYLTTPYQYCFDEFKFCPNCGAEMRGDR